ncbi:hypothetical protein [Kingella sp. (in: b-proteobacteria)]|uniref:hypothetical protein n=1 Tax=Kingella sp. (in: b-proteobacteria) TaxID=2020713 RepID=UPI0026DAE927|nr:hypothetical protein [Kingella sp. (in: b-proteobacteria)]MDO4657604.1 hypothetical protein [Kingella sp. (in: b-proteobacteria)]
MCGFATHAVGTFQVKSACVPTVHTLHTKVSYFCTIQRQPENPIHAVTPPFPNPRDPSWQKNPHPKVLKTQSPV